MSQNTKKLSESGLFKPIKEFFESQGYSCDGEVNDIDLYMEKDKENLAVELKVSLDFKAVMQGAVRQKIADTVYIGIYRPKDLYSSLYRDKIYLLKRLGIGLIVVSPKTGRVEVVNEPIIRDLSTFKTRNKGKRKAVSEEFKKRKSKINTGGVTGRKLITSYREEALLVLDALCALGGEATTADIKKLSNVDKTTTILYRNVYGWFENVSKGRYKITNNGFDALEEFETVLSAMSQYMNYNE